MTVKEARVQSLEELQRIYAEGEAAAISALLLEKVTGVDRNQKALRQAETLNDVQEAFFHQALERLMRHEPIQYVLQEAWFCGLSFYVDKRVLIPRPETEELVEWIIAGCRFPVNELSVLDIGTGSGCIPISLKRRIRKAEVWACDVSADALDVAKYNARSIGVDIQLVKTDFLNHDDWSLLPVVDVLVSNPPYIPAAEKTTMAANVLDYEPALALFVEDGDPLIFYRQLAVFGKTKLKADGSIYAELHEDLADATADLFKQQRYEVEIKEDMQGKKRMLRARIV